MKIIKIEFIKMLRSMIQLDSGICELIIEDLSIYPKKFLQILEFEDGQVK